MRWIRPAAALHLVALASGVAFGWKGYLLGLVVASLTLLLVAFIAGAKS